MQSSRVWQWQYAQVLLLSSFVGLCNIFTLLCECERVWYLSLRVFLVLNEGVSEHRREENWSLPRIKHNPSIWPQRYHSITSCWWNTTSYTHAHFLPRTHMHMHMHRLWYSWTHICVNFHKHTRYSLDLSNTQAVLCATSSNGRTIRRTGKQLRIVSEFIQLSFPLTNPNKSVCMCVVGLRPAVF